MITLLILLCLVIILAGFIQGNGLIWYPFLFAAVVLGWVVPQLLAIEAAGSAPGHSLQRTTAMVTLSLLAAWAGYSFRTGRVNRSAFNVAPQAYNRNWLHIYTALAALFGAYFFFRVADLAAIAIEDFGGQWTGVITIFAFFASLLTYAFSLSVGSLIAERRFLPLATLLFCTIFILNRILIQGRREGAAAFAISAALFFYFRYRRQVPRSIQIAALAIGALFVTSIGDYRGTMLNTESGLKWTGAGLDDLMKIDFKDNFLLSDRPTTSMELFNAALVIEGAERGGYFDGGLSLWNRFIFSYVPAQIVGRDLKESLQFDLRNTRDDFGYIWHVGTTSTGFAEAFRSFWYFGALVFFAIGRILRYWMTRALTGDYLGAVMMFVLLPKSLIAITHNASQFFLEFVSLFVFVILPLRLLSYGPNRSARRAALP